MNYISLNREELKKLTQDLKIFSDNITGKYIEFTEDYENNINYVYDYYKNYVHNIVTDNFEDLKGIEIDDSLYEIKYPIPFWINFTWSESSSVKFLISSSV